MITTEERPKMKRISRKEWSTLESTKFEKIHSEIFTDAEEASKIVAHEIAALIRYKTEKNEKCVLGLATGSSPIKVYKELIRMHREEGLSFRNVVSFNLDEYYGLSKSDVQSYIYFMHHHLFDHVDILAENINIPNGKVPYEHMSEACTQYEEKIESYGGLDFQLLGIGRTGHIGFNEPGSKINSLTRMITLDHLTIQDNAFAFSSMADVPTKAVTMGVGTILNAKRVVILAWGMKKAEIVKKTVEGEMSSDVPATFLQQHKDVSFVMDESAALNLTRIQTPWLVGECEWTEALKRKAVVWLSQKVKKPILKLTDRDYNDNGMSNILGEGGSYQVNIKMFNHFQHTITGWPGGKPNADDSHRPERANPAKKRIIIFSPHPDDDVISMGGTFLRLVDQGHEVHVAYQTSGNIAVADHEAYRFAEFAKNLYEYAAGEKADDKVFDKLFKQLKSNTNKDVLPVDVRKIKGLIRRGEAISACRYYGIPDSQVHYLDLPFYETGKVEKNPLGDADVKIIKDLIEEIKPHQIYAAGDLADPHGTHEVCLKGIFAAVEQLKPEKFMKDCWMWLYRGAWHEFPIDEIEMAVPISPEELMKKRVAIWRHQSQKDGVVFQGEDDREFWQRSEDRNRATAKEYDVLGLPEYEAIEGFVRYHY
ncbi:glucosamine-6-phosphate deaminase [Reichenbachiella agarivorans]|uniref:Glucosamine-6-phosphate deaminase n=1 Tax=Reichenbachiella agarivorans TaxID=2979464 RepID=A0ABY6CPF9_9BACT|nr:glucosamine-6-phosphate deaminase [Reichenbachiella agarivorans]UXP32403.1 glucosamine-6-phosphate deaminase [Reichenbachiella agarivorans]